MRTYGGRNVPVQAIITPAMKAWLEQRADAEAVSVSTLIRQWIVREAKRDVQSSQVVQDGNLSA